MINDTVEVQVSVNRVHINFYSNKQLQPSFTEVKVSFIYPVLLITLDQLRDCFQNCNDIQFHLKKFPYCMTIHCNCGNYMQELWYNKPQRDFELERFLSQLNGGGERRGMLNIWNLEILKIIMKGVGPVIIYITVAPSCFGMCDFAILHKCL